MAGSLRQRRDAQKIKETINQLVTTSQVIQRRQELSRQEVGRVKHSFQMLDSELGSSNSEPFTRQQRYHSFLKRVQEVCGGGMVVLCAVGLGQSQIGDFSTGVRLELPINMKERRSALNSEILDKLAEEYSHEGEH